MSEGKPADNQATDDQATVKATARIDWRKLLVPSLFIMVLPTISAIVLDKSLGTFPYITIVAIVICFPVATFWVIRVALQEMDRVIAEVAPPPLPEADEAEASNKDEVVMSSEGEVAEIEAELSSSP